MNSRDKIVEIMDHHSRLARKTGMMTDSQEKFVKMVEKHFYVGMGAHRSHTVPSIYFINKIHNMIPVLQAY